MNPTAKLLVETLSKEDFANYTSGGEVIIREGNEPYLILKEEEDELENK